MQTIHVDSFGRLVIPKTIRDELGISVDTPITLIQQDNYLILKPENAKDLISIEDGITVYTGQLKGNVELAIQEMRNDRLQELSKI